MFSLYFTALKSLAVKETNRYLRIWVQTLVPPVITTSLYFVIFGKMIGGRIGDMGGFSYMEFIVPGLIMMSAITSSYANVSSSFFSQKFQKKYRRNSRGASSNSCDYLGICDWGRWS